MVTVATPESGFYFGPVGFLLLLLLPVVFGLVAMLLGLIALVRINRSGGALGGRAVAIGAIVLGAILVLSSPLLVVYLSSAHSSAPDSVIEHRLESLQRLEVAKPGTLRLEAERNLPVPSRGTSEPARQKPAGA